MNKIYYLWDEAKKEFDQTLELFSWGEAKLFVCFPKKLLRKKLMFISVVVLATFSLLFTFLLT